MFKTKKQNLINFIHKKISCSILSALSFNTEKCLFTLHILWLFCQILLQPANHHDSKNEWNKKHRRMSEWVSEKDVETRKSPFEFASKEMKIRKHKKWRKKISIPRVSWTFLHFHYEKENENVHFSTKYESAQKRKKGSS